MAVVPELSVIVFQVLPVSRLRKTPESALAASRVFGSNGENATNDGSAYPLKPVKSVGPDLLMYLYVPPAVMAVSSDFKLFQVVPPLVEKTISAVSPKTEAKRRSESFLSTAKTPNPVKPVGGLICRHVPLALNPS